MSPFLRFFTPTNVLLPSIFRKLVGITLLSLRSSLSFCRGILHFFLTSAAAFFISLALNAARFSNLFCRIKRQPQAWWFFEVEEAVSERRKAFATANRSDEDRQACFSGFVHTFSVITKAKAEAWQATCLSHSPKSNPKFVYFVLSSVDGYSSFSPLMFIIYFAITGTNWFSNLSVKNCV